ncbi:MAG TPA: hypothetical protein VGF81_05255 [Solirubrobacteraceae bacterium]|jgi:hypothetical protein
MRRIGTSRRRLGPTGRRSKFITAVALAGVSLFFLMGLQVAMAGAVAQATTATGFTKPFSGKRQYEQFAPVEVTSAGRLNRPIGQRVADRIARKLGLRKASTFTERQYRQFVTGKGVGGSKADARLVDRSVRIFTNTVGRPLYSYVNGRITRSILASYGLFVTRSGLLESLANKHAPTRKANSVIAPGGYLGMWCKANGAKAALVALYRSAYTVEAVYGNRSQQISGVAQLVTNKKGGVTSEVGMSMVPSIWFVNFALLYTLKPALAAKMPAKWARIPSTVADAILASRTGQVPYSKYASDLR